MKRYMTGMITGSLVGAVIAGYWLMKRAKPQAYQMVWRQARRWAPAAVRVARSGGRRAWAVARRRLG